NRIIGLVVRCRNDQLRDSGSDSLRHGSDPAVVNKRETSWQHFAEGYVMKVAHCIRQRPGKLLAELREQKSTASSYAANVCSHFKEFLALDVCRARCEHQRRIVNLQELLDFGGRRPDFTFIPEWKACESNVRRPIRRRRRKPFRKQPNYQIGRVNPAVE